VAQDDLTGQVALVTGGGRGIGAGIARELAGAGARVAVAARTRKQVDEIAREIDGLALEVDVSDRADVERMVAETERELGPIQVLVANAGIGGPDGLTWEVDPDAWWQVFEVNVLGVHLCCRTVIPGMLERGDGRIVITGSGAAYLPGARSTVYPASKAAVWRYGETLANELEGRLPVFIIRPRPHRRPGELHRQRTLDAAELAHGSSTSSPGTGRRARRPLPPRGHGASSLIRHADELRENG
jgi:NAD(P)-dependent dehydrogenase (short-subunit alcohol dehydrogenase family)